MSNKKALDAIAKINKKFPQYANNIQIRGIFQDIQPSDPSFNHTDPSANKGTPALSDIISAFTKDTSLKDQKSLSDSLGRNIVGKRVKDFTFYTDLSFNKVDNQFVYKTDVYEIIYISEVVIQNTTILYKCVGVN